MGGNRVKSHITRSKNEKVLEEAIKEQLTNARTTGMGIGAKSISKVIYDKATAEGKTDSEKLDDIIDFCKVGLAIKEDLNKGELS